MTLYERVLNLCNKNGITISNLGDFLHINLSGSTISHWKSGSVPRATTVKAIADYFGVTVAYLMGDEDAPSEPKKEGKHFRNMVSLSSTDLVPIRIAASVRAGFDGVADITYDDDVEVLPKTMLKGYSKDELLVVRVSGDSMYPRICNGDRVLVHLQDSVDSGSVAVVVYNGDEATIKTVKYIYGEDWLELIPANPEYKTRRIEGADLEQCYVVGKVLTLLRDFD